MKYIFILMILLLASCTDNSDTTKPSENKNYKIIVFSDAHLFDPNLGTSGEAFENYIKNDRKMIAESDAIMQEMIANIINEQPDLVLVTGDLTKDGEKSSHIRFAQYMQQLTSQGIKICLMPGNHDISNPYAISFNGNNINKTDNISKEDFKSIYSTITYNQVLESDNNSLSYIIEPLAGLQIISIDALIYQNGNSSAGKIQNSTLEWACNKIKEANQSGKIILGIMHHGLNEHFAGQSQIFPEYLTDSWTTDSKQLAIAGLKIIFTGHFHSNDAAINTLDNNYIIDIETGSLVTHPHPFRVINLNLNEKTLDIKTKYIEKINYNLGNFSNFHDYSEDYLSKNLDDLFISMLTSRLGLSPEQAKDYSDKYKEDVKLAISAHYHGDESPSAETLAKINQYSKDSDIRVVLLAGLLKGIWTDTKPKDNNLFIDLKSANIK